MDSPCIRITIRVTELDRVIRQSSIMGNIYSLYRMTFPSKSLFSVDQIPDLTGQVTIVTGGNTGIGKETCKVLLLKNAKVYLAARSKARADEAIQWLERETNGKSPIFLELDLANLDSVREAAEEFMSVNSHMHLTPIFTLVGGHARVVTTSSMAAFAIWKGSIVWETLGTDMASQKACKKAGTSMLSAPSTEGTNILRKALIVYPASQGALTQLWAGTMPEGLEHNGKFLVPWAQVGVMPPGARDGKVAEKLWTWLEEQVKGH
ncbi:short chain dehydrogenase domain-containing protein [Rhizoctonia solani AG-1 IA]|uniref:Short chain dehydrogenase domain-containing protein n=1 Tax=Thanatephorus cucumeris (strain AG1-IA) TaxID=983506 RepID=L8X7M3_THACA|nr:short chain dehydrogenase domain-containing protein [Rhizoctonia solani AG-1 IA]